VSPSRPVSIEDFRPATLREIVGQESAIARLDRLARAVVAGRIVPSSLLLHGPPGVGKTTAARAFGRAALGEQYENSFNQLDAGDDRSVRFVQQRLAPVAGQPPARGAPFRIVFFDEADDLPPEVQAALRPLMEGTARTCVFILACNQLDRVSEAIRSRCTVLEFSRLTPDQLQKVLDDAAARLALSVPPPQRTEIVAHAHGIPREVVKLLMEVVATDPEEAIELAPVTPSPPATGSS